jgi:hypothetical protein
MSLSSGSRSANTEIPCVHLLTVVNARRERSDRRRPLQDAALRRELGPASRRDDIAHPHSWRQGARPRVADAAAVASEARTGTSPAAPHPRFDFRPTVPNVSTFPRAAWLRSLRAALAQLASRMSHAPGPDRRREGPLRPARN